MSIPTNKNIKQVTYNGTIIPLAVSIGDKVPAEYSDYVVEAEALVLAQSGTYDNILILEDTSYISIGFLTSDFEIQTYNASTTEYTASGFWYAQYNKSTEVWTLNNYTETTSPGSSFLNNGVFTNTEIMYNSEVIFPVAAISDGGGGVIDVYTAADMSAKLSAENIDKYYRYKGVTGTYVYDDLYKVIQEGSSYVFEHFEQEQRPGTPYVLFYGSTLFRISTTTLYGSGTIEYSTDGTTWATWDGSSITAVMLAGSYKIYFRGTGNSVVSANSYDTYSKWSISGSNVVVEGNSEALLDYQTVLQGGHPNIGSYAFHRWLRENGAIISAENLVLGSIDIRDYAYGEMFYNCENLRIPPKILARSMNGTGCMSSMCSGCYYLNTLPKLYTQDLAAAAYANMFTMCSCLKVSATQGGEYQYEWRVPYAGTGTVRSESLYNTFYKTGGTFTGSPSINTTYYTTNPPI